jgi:metallophosphoesterase (TIGR00282 family)
MSVKKFLYFGDLVGRPGCFMFQKHAQQLKKQHDADAILVNGENTAVNGRGITPRTINFLKHNGADVITGGNHMFQRKEVYETLNERTDVLRPANFPADCPGKGVTTFRCGDTTIGVINAQGRIFMRELVSDPFKAIASACTYLKHKTSTILLDFHGETTSEKSAIAHCFDGQISAMVGTHTHVQTADERILPGGTSIITDLGMSGALHSIIGMKKEKIIYNLTTQLPVKFEVEETPPYMLSGVCIAIDTDTGKTVSIERFRVVDEDVNLHSINSV